jgi:hypothetical protein
MQERKWQDVLASKITKDGGIHYERAWSVFTWAANRGIGIDDDCDSRDVYYWEIVHEFLRERRLSYPNFPALPKYPKVTRIYG